MLSRLALFASALVLGLAPGAPADDMHAVEELIAVGIYAPAPDEDYSLVADFGPARTDTVAYADDFAGQPSEVFPVQPALLIAAASELRLSLTEPAQDAELATLIGPSALSMEALDIEAFGSQPFDLAMSTLHRGEDVQTA